MAKPPSLRRVVMLHGIWMPGVSMAWLGARLSAAGFEPEVFAYAGAGGGPQATLPRLIDSLRRAPGHVLAHSLGGLMTLSALSDHPDLPVRRVVCLGSPLLGSAAAHGLASHAWSAPALGRAADLLKTGCPPWRGEAQVGLIAGSSPHGLGRYFGRFDGDSDGTVAVSETRLPGLAAHAVIPASHSGLLFSAQAARMAEAFFRRGRFGD
ncbi:MULTISPECIES: alpha/beta hydrolase [unclassified Lysobacter]|uniref:esterase/lipase family protein n=1 Tax=unclassified Lysobacter TaxID=2635362 RepID=UPI001BE6D5E7|nr:MULTISPECIES: alpha/beta hydrolase [unclassified Lysobacter]MBT2745816.1 alpha/beta hydrolase [Lysobacter sp. ISL-42]MBT2749625.1 alpha/beta hydrolase [Lysobacter sp. ISL-50]MBT2778731.1 alpha/beta hydrolase [Lysobacter sp. ISL-54]MBT2781326.1 alpha/beta hydrolase [Lysobacter sp. ISL-52]